MCNRSWDIETSILAHNRLNTDDNKRPFKILRLKHPIPYNFLTIIEFEWNWKELSSKSFLFGIISNKLSEKYILDSAITPKDVEPEQHKYIYGFSHDTVTTPVRQKYDFG